MTYFYCLGCNRDRPIEDLAVTKEPRKTKTCKYCIAKMEARRKANRSINSPSRKLARERSVDWLIRNFA